MINGDLTTYEFGITYSMSCSQNDVRASELTSDHSVNGHCFTTSVVAFNIDVLTNDLSEWSWFILTDSLVIDVFFSLPWLTSSFHSLSQLKYSKLAVSNHSFQTQNTVTITSRCPNIVNINIGSTNFFFSSLIFVHISHIFQMSTHFIFFAKPVAYSTMAKLPIYHHLV